MASTADPSVAAPARRKFGLSLPAIAIAVILAVTGFFRLTVGAERPLWLDEAQTGMLVMQPSWPEFFRQLSYDINAPLYSVLARLWATFAGVSNPGLRSLPVLLGLIAPMIALIPRNLIDRPIRFTWCALMACWIPGIIFAQEARWYTLALALGMANAVTFIALLREPSRRNAWVWAGVSSLMVLAHYYGVILLAFQGPAYLAIHKRRALATWPAALAFIPAVAALAMHAARLVAFTTPGMAWIPLLRPSDFYWKLGFFFGNTGLVYLIGLWLVLAIAIRLLAGSLREMVRIQMGDGLWTTALCSLAASGLAIGAGFLAPIAVDRYFTEFVPGIMLGLAKFAVRFDRRSTGASAAVLVTLYFGFAIFWTLMIRPSRDIHDYNYEWASDALIATHPDRLVFLWDNPMRPEKSQLADLGGFFFTRAGLKTPVDPVVLARGEDPNKVLLAHAAAPGSAILWISDRGVRGTAANRFKPAIGRIDPSWQCRNFGNWQYRIIACSRDPSWRTLPRNPLAKLSRESAGMPTVK